MTLTLNIATEWVDEATSLPCLILVGPLGALNGYVGVPPEHPWFGLDYDDAWCGDDECRDHVPVSELEAHGGITFSGDWKGAVEHDDAWYFGFDTAHYGDMVPEFVKLAPGSSLATGAPRDEAYVRAECVEFAAQLAAIGEEKRPPPLKAKTESGEEKPA